MAYNASGCIHKRVVKQCVSLIYHQVGYVRQKDLLCRREQDKQCCIVSEADPHRQRLLLLCV